MGNIAYKKWPHIFSNSECRYSLWFYVICHIPLHVFVGSGQIMASSHDRFPPKGSWGWEMGPLISAKSRSVKYCNLARWIKFLCLSSWILALEWATKKNSRRFSVAPYGFYISQPVLHGIGNCFGTQLFFNLGCGYGYGYGGCCCSCSCFCSCSCSCSCLLACSLFDIITTSQQRSHKLVKSTYNALKVVRFGGTKLGHGHAISWPDVLDIMA